MKDRNLSVESRRLAARRRDFILTVAGAAILWPLASAQSQEKRPVVGVLALNNDDNELIRAFVGSLEQLGYVDGRTATVVARYADANPKALPGLAADLARLKPDVIMADVPSAIKAAIKAAPSVPIVGATLGAPVEQGLANNFAHPDGNVTGIASQIEDLNAKLLDIALDIFPSARRFGVLLNPEGDVFRVFRRELQAAADKRGIGFEAAEAHLPGEIESALRTLADARVAFLILQPNGLFNTERARVAELAMKAHLPSFSGTSRNAEAGDFVTYGVNEVERYRRAAFFVGKILKGAKAGDLPIEFPTEVDLTVNLKTAKALGIDVPQSLLLRADKVIE